MKKNIIPGYPTQIEDDNGNLLAVIPQEISDHSEELVQIYREELKHLDQEYNANKRNRELVEAIKSLKAEDKPRTFSYSSILPNKRSNSIGRKMMKLFETNQKVKNYLLASCITPTITTKGGKRVKLRIEDYIHNKERYDKQIQNCFETLRKYLAPHGYTIKFTSQESEIISLQK